MAMLKNRLSKLENKLDKKVMIEDIIRLVRHKDSLCDKEQNRIISSDLFQQLNNPKLIYMGK